jgi:rod shape determining protein RodA|tara:strand:- start:6607 stop:7761 length:1155 start_codon:yes stop_codon:yes gene_type:complete
MLTRAKSFTPTKAISFLARIDWILFVSALLLTAAGLITMNSLVGNNPFFEKQLIWTSIAVAVFFVFSAIDFRFLRRTPVVVSLFVLSVLSLIILLLLGDVVKGAQTRFDLGFFGVQPSDLVKLVVILVLAKYFSRRHVEIAHIRHILVSGFYAFVLFFLVFLQPDFGSAIIIFLIWLGMVLISGISKKHLALVFLLGALVFAGLWSFAFEDYQRQRILTFIHPLADLQGTGYNAYQSTVAVGSGEILGRGVGYGTQSKLQFLPEYETDFIFAAFAEEWGFIGVLILFVLFGIVLWRIIRHAMRGATNFEVLFGAGLAILVMSQFTIHVGMNIGLLPVTGSTLPFMSYGGSHLVAEFIGLGILMGMSRYSRVMHRDDGEHEEFPT